jgi:hypothetical protein
VSENEVVITTEKKKKKRGGAALILGGVALTAAVGGVFAYTGTIQINGGNAIELGGGVSDVQSCTNAADTTISQTFDGTNFNVDHVTVSGIDLTNCEGRVLEVRVAASGAGVNCAVYATGDNSTTSPAGSEDAFFTIPGPSGVDSFTAYPSSGCAAADITKVILTTSNN